MIEIFSHDVNVVPDDDAEGILIISGKGWENEPFKLYLNKTEASVLLWQLTYYIEGFENG